MILPFDPSTLTRDKIRGVGIDILPGVGAGTRYMNPLFHSEYPSERDDVFALGTVLYELACGERLFAGKSDQEVWQCLQNDQFPDLSPVSSPLRQVVENCWKISDYKASNALIELST